MLRVNLLPPYIYDKQKKTKIAVLWGVGLAAVIVGMIAWAGKVSSDLSAEQAHETAAKDLQDKWNTADSNIKDVNQKIAVIKAKQDFVANAQTYNSAWPKVYEAMASVTNTDVVLNSMAVDAGNHRALHLVGFCPDEGKLARWWMSLRNDVNMFDSVTISLPPHPYIPGGANGNTRPGGFSGMGMQGGFRPGGPGGMMSGGMPGGPGGMGMMPGGMPGGPGGRMAGAGGGMGFGAGRGGQAGAATETVLEGTPGLSFVANLALNDKLAPPAGAPAWPAGGGGGMGGMGMGGMMPGGMGSMPGGMPGGPGGMMGQKMMGAGGAGAPSGKE